MLVGYQVHRVRPQDLTVEMAREQARNGWLTDNKYLAILANPDRYQPLFVDVLPDNIDDILSGQEECLFMCAQDVDDMFDHEIREKDGVMFGGEWRLTVESRYNDVYEKREYTMRNNYEEKLVHYQPNNDSTKLDKVRARRAMRELEEDIMDHGQTSGQAKEGILHGIRGRGRRGRRGRARGTN